MLEYWHPSYYRSKFEKVLEIAGVVGNGASDDSASLNEALLRFKFYRFGWEMRHCMFPAASFGISAMPLLPPDMLEIYGQGMGKTIFKQLVNGVRAFERVGTSGYNYLALRHFTVQGRWSAPGVENQSLGGDNDRPIAIDGVNRLEFDHIEILDSRQMGMTAGYCGEVYATGCRLERIARDGMNFSTSRKCIVTNNFFKGINDDAIAIHTNPAQGALLRNSMVVSSNQIEDGFGIKLLGAQKASVTGNVIVRPKGYGIYLGVDGGFGDGLNDSAGISVTGNTISDVIDATKFGFGVVRAYIQIGSNNAVAPVVGAATPTINNPKNWSYKNNASSGVTYMGTQRVTIVGNTLECTLPHVTNYSDWGFGTAFTANPANNNPSMASGHERSCIGVLLEGVTLIDAKINSNTIYGMSSAVTCQTTNVVRLSVQGNNIVRFKDFGLDMQTGSVRHGTVAFENNWVDGDPYFEHSNRVGGPNFDGRWNVGDSRCAAINTVNFNGVIAEGNTFRNLNEVLQNNGQLVSLKNNKYYCQLVGGAEADANNRGIRKADGASVSGATLFTENSNATSASYGQMTAVV